MPWLIKIAGAAVEKFSLNFLIILICLPKSMRVVERGVFCATALSLKILHFFRPYNSLEEFLRICRLPA